MRIDIGNWHLRPHEDTDLPALVKYAGNPNIARHLRERFPHPYTVEAGRRWLEHTRRQQPVTAFAIADRNELIGGIGLELRTDVYRHSAELGYWLAEPFWGKGIVVAAVEAIVGYGFGTLALARIDAGVFANNPRSARVLEKSGFVFEGRSRNAIFKDGELIDELRYARLREDGEG